MGMFNTRMPRRFNHIPIYYDERKERLAKMEENAKRELGLLPEKPFNPEDIRGKFVESTTHLKRHKEKKGRSRMSVGVSLVLIAVLLFLWYALSNGII